jgi:hypothetical protein
MADYPAVSVSQTLTDATGLRIKAWDRILQMRSLVADIFTALTGNYSTASKTIPQGIFMRVPADANKANSVTFPLLMPLATDPGMGTGTDPLTNAEQQSVRQFEAFYNDYDKSVKSTASGIEYIDGVPYGLLAKVTPQIATFIQEMKGYWIRYCLLNRFSPNIQATPTSKSLFPNPNTLVKGIALSQQPAERHTTAAATLSSIIASLFASVPAGTSGALDVGTILAAADYFRYTKGFKPIPIGGENLFVLTVPTSQKSYLLDPSNTDGLGAIWQAVSRFQNEKAANLPQVLGRVADVLLIEDPRAPVCGAYGTASGSQTASATNAVLVDKYLKPGLNDQRGDIAAQYNPMEACFFLGNGAIAEVEPEKPHYETESQFLGKTVIKGALGSLGYNRMDYDKSTAAAKTLINQSSGVIFCRKQTLSF